MECLIWMCLESWKLDSPTILLQMDLRACFEVLAERKPMHIPMAKNGPPLEEGGPLQPSTQLWEEMHMELWGGRNTFLLNKITLIQKYSGFKLPT